MGFTCEIKFDENPYGVYFSGQHLSGYVEISTDAIKKVRGMYLKISGLALCHWTERHSTGSGKNRRTHTVSYDGRDDYLESLTYLFGSQNGESLELPMGITRYNFACVLPAQLPTSFEGTYGHIRYTVKVVLDRPWKFDQTYKVGFTVLKQSDLNYDTPALRIPSQMDLTKTFCCWPCESGPLVISAAIPQSGYVPGQKIHIIVNLANGSDVDIYEVGFSLKKIIYYHSQSPPKSKTEIIQVIEECSPGIPAGSNGKIERKLLVPAVPPTNISSCRVIHLMYEVQVEIKVSGAHTNPLVKLPITIGTIPLNMNMPLSGNVAYPPQQPQPVTQQPYPGNNGFHSVNIGFNSPSAPSSYPGPSTPFLPNAPPAPETPTDLPPPSYEQCCAGTQQIKDADEDQNGVAADFAPRYPVYNFNNTTVPLNFPGGPHK